MIDLRRILRRFRAKRTEINSEPVQVAATSRIGSIADLRKQIRELSTALVEEASHEGEVPKEEVERLHDLWRLAEVHTRIHSGRLRGWMLFIALIVPLSVVASLFLRVSSLAVSLDARISEIAFELTNRQELTDGLSPTQLSFSGVKEVRLPRSRDRAAATFTLEGAGAVTLVTLDAEKDGVVPGRLTLAPLTLPAESHCRIASGDDPGRIRLGLRSAEFDLRVSVHGRIRMGIPGEPDFYLEMRSPRSLALVPQGDQIEIELLFTELPARLLQPRLAVASLDLTRIDETETDEGTLVHRASTIRSGKLYFETLDGRTRTLRQDQMLRFAASPGRLRTLGFEKDSMILSYSGEVEGMTLGNDRSARSLMPSVLLWLHQREGFTFLWGTALGILLFVEALFVVWKRLS